MHSVFEINELANQFWRKESAHGLHVHYQRQENNVHLCIYVSWVTVREVLLWMAWNRCSVQVWWPQLMLSCEPLTTASTFSLWPWCWIRPSWRLWMKRRKRNKVRIQSAIVGICSDFWQFLWINTKRCVPSCHLSFWGEAGSTRNVAGSHKQKNISKSSCLSVILNSK